MSEDEAEKPFATTAGSLLRRWRNASGLSQMDVALEVGMSTRHLSFLESGRALPSETMLYALSLALNIPESERNTLRLAAGFKPRPDAAPPSSDKRGQVRRVIEQVMNAHREHPVLVKDQIWDIVEANACAREFFAELIGRDLFAGDGYVNVLELIFAPDLLRPHIENWDEVADAVVRHVHHEIGLGIDNPAFRSVLDRTFPMPGFEARWKNLGGGTNDNYSTRYIFNWRGKQRAYDSILMSLGAPYEAILSGIRFDTFYPVELDA